MANSCVLSSDSGLTFEDLQKIICHLSSKGYLATLTCVNTFSLRPIITEYNDGEHDYICSCENTEFKISLLESKIILNSDADDNNTWYKFIQILIPKLNRMGIKKSK